MNKFFPGESSPMEALIPSFHFAHIPQNVDRASINVFQHQIQPTLVHNRKMRAQEGNIHLIFDNLIILLKIKGDDS